MDSKHPLLPGYSSVLAGMKQIIPEARHRTLSTVNREFMLHLRSAMR